MNILITFLPVDGSLESNGMNCMPPMAIYYLASIIKNNGYEVKTVDPSFYTKNDFFKNDGAAVNCIKSMLNNQYDLICLSSNSGNWGSTLKAIKIIKELQPNSPIAVGGVHPSYFDEYILKNTPVDFVIRGEGEKSLVKLIENLNNLSELKHIQGLSYIDENDQYIRNEDSKFLTTEELEKYREVSYDLIPTGVYPNLIVESSRGCQFSCIFCSVVYRHNWRGIPAEEVVKRIKDVVPYIKEKSTDNTVYLVDDCFTADPKRALEILHEIDKENLGIKFAIEARVTDLLTPGFIEQIPAHLIGGMQIGVECGYDEGLIRIRKGLTVKQLEDCVKLIARTDLINVAHLSFIIGFPWETQEDILKTVHMAGYLAQTYGMSSNLNWLWITPSDLWRIKEQYGIYIKEDVFDDPKWIASKELFYKAHPNINPDTYKIIDGVARAYTYNHSVMRYTPVGYEKTY